MKKLKFIKIFTKLRSLALVFVLALFLALSETILRRINLVQSGSFLEILGFGFLFFALIIYTNKWVSWLVAVFLGFGILFEFLNLAYFGYWTNPFDYYLAFAKAPEVLEASSSIIEHKITSILLMFFALFLIFVAVKKKCKINGGGGGANYSAFLA